MSKSLVVLIIDNDTFAQEHPEGEALTPEFLRDVIGKDLNDEAAFIYGYEGWNTLFEPTDRLLALIADQGSERRRAES